MPVVSFWDNLSFLVDKFAIYLHWKTKKHIHYWQKVLVTANRGMLIIQKRLKNNVFYCIINLIAIKLTEIKLI